MRRSDGNNHVTSLLMKALSLVLILFATASRATETASDEPPPLRWAATLTLATAATVGTFAAAAGGGWAVPTYCFAQEGRPSATCAAGGLLLGSALQVGLSIALLPLILQLGDADGLEGSIAATRLEQWRWARWAALGAGLFIATYVVGAAIDRVHFGSGQYVMAVGAAGVGVTWITFDVLQLIGATRGYLASRSPKPARP
jgi:hypothetical protein